MKGRKKEKSNKELERTRKRERKIERKKERKKDMACLIPALTDYIAVSSSLLWLNL